MTLHCNKVKLWPCPEWVAKMCVHAITRDGAVTWQYDWALERYLIWADNNVPLRIGNGGFYCEDKTTCDKFKQEVLEAMKAPDLKVWME